MTPQELKNSILQLAIQGRLVEQRPEEGTASELLREILAATASAEATAVKKGGARSRATALMTGARPSRRTARPASPSGPASPTPVPPEEQPFDIPESWEWVRIGDLGASTDTDSFCDGPFGSNLKTSHHISSPEVRIIQLSNIGEDGWKENNVKYTSFRHLETVIPRCEVHPGDFVIAKMMPAGRTIQVPELGTRITLGSDAMKFVPHPLLNKQFLLYAMRSHVFLGQVYAEAHGITRVRTTLNSVKSYFIPLPPLAEQKRIVAKIEELLPLIDRYEKAWSKLEDFNRRFPVDMQKSVLQMAIQGKLVEQRPEEGTGEELLREILAATASAKAAAVKKGGSRSRATALRTGGTSVTGETSARPARRAASPSRPAGPASPTPVPPEDQPFEIPESWVWVRLEDAASVQLGKMLDKGKNKGTPYPYLANLSVRWRSFDLSDLRTMPFTESECEKFALLPGDVLMCEGGVPGRCAVWREKNSPVKYQKAIHRIRSTILFPDYTQKFFEAICDSSWFAERFTGTTIKHLPRETLMNIPIPLPPLAEQKRIVAKLEEILPLCERLKGAMPL